MVEYILLDYFWLALSYVTLNPRVVVSDPMFGANVLGKYETGFGCILCDYFYQNYKFPKSHEALNPIVVVVNPTLGPKFVICCLQVKRI